MVKEAKNGSLLEGKRLKCYTITIAFHTYV